MRDYIDRIKEDRDAGLNRALDQGTHEAVNARYPGTTLEYCCECDDPTGRAGRGEDSVFVEVGEEEIGPLCEECCKKYKEEDAP